MIAAVVMASAGFLVSCVELETEQPLADAVGYLVAPSLEVDVTVDDLQLTKTLDFTVEQPSESDIRFVVKDKDNNVRYEGNGLWNEPLVLPVGSYTIEATAGSNTYGAPYFTGTASGTVEALDREVPQLEMSLDNSLLRVTVSDEMKTHFTPDATVVLGSGAYSAPYGEWFYAPSGSGISLSLSGKSSTDGDVTFNYTLTSPSPKVAYDVVCDKAAITISEINQNDAWASRVYITSQPTFTGNISEANKQAVVYEAIPSSSSDWTTPETPDVEDGVLVFKDLEPGTEYKVRARVGNLESNIVLVTPSVDGLSASAVHTFTNNELDGTDVTPVFSKSDYIKNAITSWTVNVCTSDGTPLRTQKSVGASDGSAITATDRWPYLPTGAGQSYKLTASAVMDGQTYTYDLPLTVPSTPDFSLTLSAYTSYDKYAATNGISQDINGANNCDPTTLYNAGGAWGISTNIMKNTNYSKTLVIDIDGDAYSTCTDFDANSHTESILGLSWSAHTLKVSFTFDGKTQSKTQTHHITGLPYSKDFTTDSSIDGWSFIEKNYDKTYEREYKSEVGYIMYYAYTNDYGCNIFSPTFFIPQDSNVIVSSSSVYYAGTTLHNDKTYTVYVGLTTGTTVKQDKNTSITEKEYCSTSGFNKAQISSPFTMTNQMNRFSFSHDADLAKYQGSEHYLYFGSFTLLYSN